MRVQRGHLRVPFVRDLAREALEQDARERVDVGAGIDGPAFDLLRRDVVNGSDELSGLG